MTNFFTQKNKTSKWLLMLPLLLHFQLNLHAQYVGFSGTGQVNLPTGGYGIVSNSNLYPYTTATTTVKVQGEVFFDTGVAGTDKTATAGSQTTATLYWTTNSATVSNINADGTGGTGWTAVNGTNFTQSSNNDRFDFDITGVTAGTDIMYYIRYAQTSNTANRYLHFLGTSTPHTTLPSTQNQLYKIRFNAATTYNEKRIDGNYTDWQANELIHSSAGRDWYVSWDATYLYVRLVNLGGNTDRINIAIDNDPATVFNSDVSAFSGVSFRGYLTPEFIVQSTATTNLNLYPRSSTTWGASSNVYASGANLFRNNGDAEIRILRSDLGISNTANPFGLYCWLSDSGDAPYTNFITDNPTAGRANSAAVWNSSASGLTVNTDDFVDTNCSTLRTLNVASGFRNIYFSNDVATINTSTTISGNILINTGATLQLTGGIGDDLNLNGNFTNNGTYTDGGRATFFRGGATEQTIGGTTNTSFRFLIIDKTAGNVKLTNSINIAGTSSVLDLDNVTNTAKLNLNGFNALLGTTGSIAEDLSNNKIITDLTPALTSNNAGGYVGFTGYDPIAYAGGNGIKGTGLDLNDTGAGTYTVDVKRYNYGAQARSEKGIKRIFQIVSTGTVTSTNLKVMYPSSEINGLVNTDNTRMFISRWTLATGWESFKHNGTTTTHSLSAGVGTIERTGVTAFSHWTVSSDNTTSPLPITLLSFTAKAQENNTILNWITSTEKNNKGFYIEKSANAQDFETIGFVEGVGNSTAKKAYTFVDNELKTDTYYRLRQTDFDGSVTFSPIVFVATRITFKIYPNPVNSQIKLIVPQTNDELTINVVNAQGKNILAQHTTNREAETFLNNSLTKLPKGLYVIEFVQNNKRWSEKIVKD